LRVNANAQGNLRVNADLLKDSGIKDKGRLGGLERI